MYTVASKSVEAQRQQEVLEMESLVRNLRARYMPTNSMILGLYAYDLNELEERVHSLQSPSVTLSAIDLHVWEDIKLDFYRMYHEVVTAIGDVEEMERIEQYENAMFR